MIPTKKTSHEQSKSVIQITQPRRCGIFMASLWTSNRNWRTIANISEPMNQGPRQLVGTLASGEREIV
jgi:hypothetical protein